MAMGLCLAQANIAAAATASAASTVGSVSAENPPASAEAGAERSVAWTAAPLDVTTLLAMLNLAMVPDAEARLQALHSLAAITPGDSNNSVSQEGGDTHAESETATRGTLLFCVCAKGRDIIPPPGCKQTPFCLVSGPWLTLYRY
jgi:hypothetical protein